MNSSLPYSQLCFRTPVTEICIQKQGILASYEKSSVLYRIWVFQRRPRYSARWWCIEVAFLLQVSTVQCRLSKHILWSGYNFVSHPISNYFYV